MNLCFINKDIALSHGEDFMFNGGLLQNAVEMFAVGVGDENLSEILGCKEVDDVLDALGVQFVEKVVE